MDCDRVTYDEITNYQDWLIHSHIFHDQLVLEEFQKRTNIRKGAWGCQLNDYNETPGPVLTKDNEKAN